MIVQAEGRKAAENLEEILEVPGIGIVFVGPYDLSSSLGVIGQINHPKVLECMKESGAAAEAIGQYLANWNDNEKSRAVSGALIAALEGCEQTEDVGLLVLATGVYSRLHQGGAQQFSLIQHQKKRGGNCRPAWCAGSLFMRPPGTGK